jgi:hypothetical protein
VVVRSPWRLPVPRIHGVRLAVSRAHRSAMKTGIQFEKPRRSVPCSVVDEHSRNSRRNALVFIGTLQVTAESAPAACRTRSESIWKTGPSTT